MLAALTLGLALAAQPSAYTIDAPRAEGVWLSAALGGGYVGRDGVLGASVGAGVETAPFALHLDVPLTLRVLDLAPPTSPALPSACRYVRCEEWTDAGELSADAVSRVVEELRVLRPGDAFHALGGRLFATLGRGQHLARYTNAAEWDRRGSGLYAVGNVPVARTRIEGVAGRLLAPQDLVAVRISSSPLASDAPGADDVTRFLDRLRLGVEGAADFRAPVATGGAPAVDGNGAILPGSAARTLAGVAVDAGWRLLDDGGGVQVEPWVSGAAMSGLVERAVAEGGAPGVGAGASAGLDVTLDVIFVALRLSARGTLDTPRHRSAVFGTLYDVDRKRALDPRGGFLDVGVAEVPAPGGAGGGGALEVVVLRAVRAGARLHVDPVVQGTELEAFAEVGAGPVLVGARALQRALRGPADVVDFGDRTFLVAEAAWSVAPPVSLFARWRHAPRFHGAALASSGGGAPGLATDDDVFVGASFDLVLQ